MKILDDMWIIIKDYLIHNIKTQGKHLRKEVKIKKFNNVIKDLPKKKIPRFGPRIYFDIKKNSRVVKYIYNLFLKKKRCQLIIEHVSLPEDYKKNNKKYDEELRKNYYNMK
jgi:hypothetical protein